MRIIFKFFSKYDSCLHSRPVYSLQVRGRGGGLLTWNAVYLSLCQTNLCSQPTVLLFKRGYTTQRLFRAHRN